MNRLLLRITRQSGYILLPVVLLLGLVALVAFLLGHESGVGRHLTLQRAEPEQALYVAEAGLQMATWQVQQANCINYTDITDSPFGNGSFSAVIDPHFGSPVDITATGTLAGGTSRSLSRSVPALEPPVTVTLQPDPAAMEDTFIYEWKPTWNYGVATQIGADTYWSDSDGRSLLKFDLSSIASSVTILNATLELHVNSPSDSGGPVGVHRMITPWNEGNKSGNTGSGATWDMSDTATPWTAPGGDFDPDPVIVTDVTPAVEWKSWDITTLVSDWISGVSPNHGLVLRMQQFGRGIYFHSSDYSDSSLRPRLTVTYACECGSQPSGTLVLQPGSAGMDSYVQNKPNDTNKGGFPDLFVDTTYDDSNSHLALLGYDVSGIPGGAIINSAQLSLYAHDVDAGVGGADITLHRMLEPWTENGVTFEFSDGTTPWAWPANFAPVPESNVTFFIGDLGWHTWDMTDLVIKWFTGVYPNNGLVLQGTSLIYWSAFHSSDYTDPALRPKLTIDYSCPCGVDCSASPVSGTLLLVVVDASSLSSKESATKALIESWGYKVTTINANAPQADYDTALANVDVTYVSGTISSAELGTKLRGATVGVVSEDSGTFDELGMLEPELIKRNTQNINIVDNTHYVTSELSIGTLAIASSPIEIWTADGGLAPGLQVLGETLVSGDGYAPGVGVMEAGAELFGGGSAAGRRVALPWSHRSTTFDLSMLTPDGLDIMKRAIEWGAGVVSGGTSTLTLAASADTWIEEATDVNYGADDWNQTGLDVGQNLRRSMIKFDVSSIPAGATVVSATLRLYVVNKLGQNDSNIGMYLIVTDWEESIVTWNSSGGGGYDPTSLAEPLVEWTIGWKEWDVPVGLIHEWIDGVTPNHGMLLDFLGSKKNHVLRFVTREYANATLHPQLVIEYTEP